MTTAAGSAVGYTAGSTPTPNITSIGSTTYGYDAYGQMTGVNGGSTAAFAWDPAGRMSSALVGLDGTKFLYDGDMPSSELRATGTTRRRHIPGLGVDEQVGRIEDTSVRYWPLQDERGSVIAMTDSTGAATFKNTYDEYGVPGAGNGGLL